MVKGTLPSAAERSAETAQKYPAFNSINLYNLRSAVTEMLAQIGRLGLFDQYSKHDISHIDKLLSMLDWIIPAHVQAKMTPADWLVIVLAIYLHDLGMLITLAEFESRDKSGFPKYREHIFAGGEGEDYRAKVELIPQDQAERFMYQEFVRTHHAKRIKSWITGAATTEFGVTEVSSTEVRKLVEELGDKFCRDLGNVCESHHLDDLFDLNKYKVSQPYGDSEAETANLHYAAIVLRTVDLLHVTKDRTPSIAFRLIDPSDPFSQEEWQKQMAVVTVRPKVAVNREGHADAALPRDTVEVHAFFNSSRGFFSLTKYMRYVAAELKQAHDWCREARLQKGVIHEFPWRYVDDSNIETEGFLSKQFEFTLDQAKILDLLTGHTLYNSIDVVIRELVQNSLDAVRFAAVCNGGTRTGSVKIAWSSEDRVLVVEDQGTGMTQDIIEQHFLKVGSSRYQDPEFKKQHPHFSPISRFGIGVLSTFMIADEVEILTCHADEPDGKARHLSLRSVHGRYLIRLIDKASPEVAALLPHGTRIRLKVRASVRMPDVLRTTQKWVVLPGCRVFVDVDGNSSKVGYENLEEVVKDFCKREQLIRDESLKSKIRVIRKDLPGLSIAFAVRWSEYFKDWSFVTLGEKDRDWLPLGLCIEGVRVTNDTPGFIGTPLVAVANASGPGGPKTNVARSGLEDTPERDEALAKIYRAFVMHVEEETDNLVKKGGFSPTWAAKDGKYLMGPLLPRTEKIRPVDLSIFSRELDKTPVLLIEKSEKREIVSPSRLQSESVFWTIDCRFFSSAELLLKEVQGEATLGAVCKSISAGKIELPVEPILCGLDAWHMLDQSAFSGKEVISFNILESQRRIDLQWAASQGRWRTVPARLSSVWTRRESISLATGPIQVVSANSYDAVRAFETLYMFVNSPVATLMRKLLDESETGAPDPSIGWKIRVLGSIASQSMGNGLTSAPADVVSREIDSIIRLYGSRVLEKNSMEDIVEALSGETWRCFDPSQWERKEKKE